MTDSSGNIMDTVFFGNKSSQGVSYGGDNRSGTLALLLLLTLIPMILLMLTLAMILLMLTLEASTSFSVYWSSSTAPHQTGSSTLLRYSYTVTD
jgi:hypothetical protein